MLQHQKFMSISLTTKAIGTNSLPYNLIYGQYNTRITPSLCSVIVSALDRANAYMNTCQSHSNIKYH